MFVSVPNGSAPILSVHCTGERHLRTLSMTRVSF